MKAGWIPTWLQEFEKEAGYAMTWKDHTAHISWRERAFRAGIHIPVGLFNVFLLYVGIIYGILFFAGFFIYELNEDWHLKDNAWLDIYGWLIGFGLGVSILYLLMKLGIG